MILEQKVLFELKDTPHSPFMVGISIGQPPSSPFSPIFEKICVSSEISLKKESFF